MNKLLALLLSAQLATLAGCASTPGDNSQINDLQQSIESLETAKGDEQYAPIAVQEAREAVEKLRTMNEEGADEAEYEHQRYLAEKKIEIAKEMITMEQAQETVANAELNRKDALLDAQRQEVADVRDRAAKMSGRAEELQQQAEDIATQETERGLVLTLENVLFETGESTLKSGAQRTVAKVAEFLNEYPDRTILVEGFTDDQGDPSYNKKLSQQRAQAVKDALKGHGVDESRINTEGYGEEFPVATNDTAAGRQHNRRVEIVVGKNGADVADRTSMR